MIYVIRLNGMGYASKDDSIINNYSEPRANHSNKSNNEQLNSPIHCQF